MIGADPGCQGKGGGGDQLRVRRDHGQFPLRKLSQAFAQGGVESAKWGASSDSSAVRGVCDDEAPTSRPIGLNRSTEGSLQKVKGDLGSFCVVAGSADGALVSVRCP